MATRPGSRPAKKAAPTTPAKAGSPSKRKTGPETQFRNKVVRLAKEHGWLVNHTLRALVTQTGGTPRWITNTTGKGYPDLTLTHPAWGRIVFLELKSERGTPSTEQKRWIRSFQRAAERAPGIVAAYVVGPQDFDVVSRMLTRPSWTPGSPTEG